MGKKEHLVNSDMRVRAFLLTSASWMTLHLWTLQVGSTLQYCNIRNPAYACIFILEITREFKPWSHGSRK